MHCYLSLPQGLRPNDCSGVVTGICGAPVVPVHLFRPPATLSTLGPSLWCHWEYRISLPNHLLSWSCCQGKHSQGGKYLSLAVGLNRGFNMDIATCNFQILVCPFEALCHSICFILRATWLAGRSSERTNGWFRTQWSFQYLSSTGFCLSAWCVMRWGWMLGLEV